MLPGIFPKISEERRRYLLSPVNGRIRLAVDTDAHNEIDDQFAIAWALLSPDRFQIEGMYAAPYSFAQHREPMLCVYELMKADRETEISGSWIKYIEWVRNFLNEGINPYQLPLVGPEEGMERSYQEIVRGFTTS